MSSTSAMQQREEHRELLGRRDSEDDGLELTELLDGDDLNTSTPAYNRAPKKRWWKDMLTPPWRFDWRHSRLRKVPNVLPTKLVTRTLSRVRISAQRIFAILAGITILSICFCGLFFPSYTDPPPHYNQLRSRVLQEPLSPGIANIENEKVFIAAALYDPGGALVNGDWGAAVHQLVDLLGPSNVHLSVYENDADDDSRTALQRWKHTLDCNTTFVEEALDLNTLPWITMPDGTRRLKRIRFLAEVRNRALQPLDTAHARFSRILYLNDVIFDPIDAANLLFSTNLDTTGQAHYDAACAVDFENPFKFYDTFATRDTHGYETGVIFYPWFTDAESGTSRRDVLAQRDAVRVTSCWGGMVAFNATWFQHTSQRTVPNNPGAVDLPLRFRAEDDLFWDASECCLIHADLAVLTSKSPTAPGIYMNPYIRVAYSKRVLEWLWLSRRFERLYTPVQGFVNWLAKRPPYNPRRLDQPGTDVTEHVWVWDAASQAALKKSKAGAPIEGLHGNYESVTRTASPGAFCGHRGLSYIEVDPVTGDRHWAQEGHVPNAMLRRRG